MSFKNNVEFTSRPLPTEWNIPTRLTGRILVGGLYEWRDECYYIIDFDNRIIRNCRIEVSDYVKEMAQFFEKTLSVGDLPYGSRSHRDAVFHFVQPHEGFCLTNGVVVVAMHNASYMRLIDFEKEEVSHFSHANGFSTEMLSATNSMNKSMDSIFYSVTDMEQRVRKYKGQAKNLDTQVRVLSSSLNNSEVICKLRSIEAIHEVKICPDENFILLTEFCLTTPCKLPPAADGIFDNYQSWRDYEAHGLHKSNLYLVDRHNRNSCSIPVNDKTPGHIEFSDVDDNRFYLSCHNLSKGHGKLILHGEGNLTVGSIQSGKPELVGTYSDPKFYRVTSHKVFQYGDAKLIAATVYPNRLYVMSDPDLEVLQDVVLYPHEPIERGRLHFSNLQPHMPIWLETSDDGRYVVLVSNEYIYVYDLALKRLESHRGYSFNGSFIGTAHITNLNDFRF